MNEEPSLKRLHAEPAPALIGGTHAEEAADLLFALLLDVVRQHQPEIAPVLEGGADIHALTPELMARALQAQGIWFQLLSIAEQNAAMRRRRHIERTRGREALRGSFSHVLAEAAGNSIGAEEIEGLLSSLRIRPVITAHPTESKRVTVLEKYRRIYLLLRELEAARWTERERRELLDDLRDQIELVWMTGELHLEKPTVEHEVLRGLHFFDESLFEKAPEMLGLLELALAEHYPGTRFELPPFFQFGSWIGGDRDGNPWVTTKVTGWTLRLNALASLRHYRERIVALAKALSITERALPVPANFRAELDRALEASGEADAVRARNPGEPYRQFLDPRAAQARRNKRSRRRPGYRWAGLSLCQCRRADPRSAGDGAGAARGAQRVARRQSGQAGAPRRRDLPLLDRAARSPREHDAHNASAAGAVVGERGPWRW